MTALLLKSSGPVADQYRVLAGDRVVGHVRQSESARWTVAYGETRARHERLRGNSRGCVAGVAKSSNREE